MQFRRMIVVFLVMMIVLSATTMASAQTNQGSLSYGDTVVGDLQSTFGDRWTFEGSDGDLVTIQLDSDAFDPVVDLYSPNQTLLTTDDDSGGNFNSLISGFELPSSGTFAIVVRGYTGTARGAYSLSLTQPQTLGSGGRFSGGSIRYGQTVDGNLNSGIGDRWTFEGTAGDLISISLTSNEFDPFLELVGVDGAVLTSDDDGGNGRNSRISRFALPSTGTYTIVARGFTDTARGAYSLILNLTDNFVTGEIAYNDVVTSNLQDNVGEFWAFEGSAGDFVTISLSSDEFDTYVELLSPNGVQIANNDDIAPENRNSRLDRIQLPADGTYLIVVHGYLDTARGEYTVTITSPNAPVNSTTETIRAGSILYGDTVSGNLTTSGGDAWAFDGMAGDVITISLSSQVFDTFVVLQDSGGNELISDDNSGTSLNALISEFVIPTNDTFTIVARGVLSSDRGTYTLSVQAGDTGEAVSADNPISIGTISRGIDAIGNVTTDSGDAWTFSGKAGEAIVIAANSDEFNTYVELFDATGQLVASNDDSGPRLNALIEAIELPSDGEYTIVVRSSLPNGRGNYSLLLQSDSPSVTSVTASDDFMQITLDSTPNALPNSVILSTIEISNLQPSSPAYCVTASLASDVFTMLSEETVTLGEVAASDTRVVEYEVLVTDVESGLLTASTAWYATQACDGTPTTLTADYQYTVATETWRIGLDVYPSCLVSGDIIISIMDADGGAVAQPQVTTTVPYSVVIEIPPHIGTYYAQAQLFCTTSSGTQIPHIYTRLLSVDHDGQLFTIGTIDIPADGDLPPDN